MRLGFKTFSSLIFLALLLGLLWHSNMVSWNRLRELHPLTLFIMGVFAAFSSAIFIQLFNSEHKSRFQIRIERKRKPKPGDIEIIASKYCNIIVGENFANRAFDLYPFLLKSVIVVIFACITMLAINDRTLAIIASMGERFNKPSPAEYCPVEDNLLPDEDDLDIPGCELVIRAYKLGYAKSLGDCDKKAKEDEGKEICTLRQHDEPFLHYTWRKLSSYWQDHRHLFSHEYLQKEQTKFEQQLDRVEDLLAEQALTLSASPRAAHLIFTNLPQPQEKWRALFESVFRPDACIQDYSKMPHTFQSSRENGRKDAESLEFTYGQLLFNSSHRSSVGYCREYQIVWDSPVDACERLARAPLGFLRDQGVLGNVEVVLTRYRIDTSLRELRSNDNIEANTTLAEADKKPPSVLAKAETSRSDLDKAISFQCFMVQDRPSQNKSYQLELGGHNFQAYEAILDINKGGRLEKIPTEYLNKLSQTLAPKFKYSAFLSNRRSHSQSATDVEQQLADSQHFMLTKLEYLRNADVILGNDWLNERDDLLEVYPWHLHLYHFVETFRQHYQQEKGRL